VARRNLALLVVFGLGFAAWGGLQRAGAHLPASGVDREARAPDSGVLEWPPARLCGVVVDGCRFAVVGDSVSSLTRDEFLDRGGETFANGGVDIETGRASIDDLAARDDEPIVIALGLMDTSLHATAEQIEDRIRTVLEHDVADVACVVWVDIKQTSNVHRDWPARSREFNRILEDVAAEYDRPVAHWSRASVGQPDWFQRDGIHPNHLGQRKYALFVARSVRRLC
jgi:lysophospholipase L1-like esterase